MLSLGGFLCLMFALYCLVTGSGMWVLAACVGILALFVAQWED